jgi:hypothetical protein
LKRQNKIYGSNSPPPLSSFYAAHVVAGAVDFLLLLELLLLILADVEEPSFFGSLELSTAATGSFIPSCFVGCKYDTEKILSWG